MEKSTPPEETMRKHHEEYHAWSKARRAFELEMIMGTATVQKDCSDQGHPIPHVRWPTGTTLHVIIGKKEKELLEDKPDLGFVRDTQAKAAPHLETESTQLAFCVGWQPYPCDGVSLSGAG